MDKNWAELDLHIKNDSLVIPRIKVIVCGVCLCLYRNRSIIVVVSGSLANRASRLAECPYECDKFSSLARKRAGPGSGLASVYMEKMSSLNARSRLFQARLRSRQPGQPTCPYKRMTIFIRKTIARRDLVNPCISLSRPARIPYKQPVRSLVLFLDHFGLNVVHMWKG